MILITGGLGFIGSHTARALLDRGEDCVLTQRRDAGPTPLFPDEVGKRVFLEQVDVTDLGALFEVGERHRITGIVHLAGAYFGDPLTDARTNIDQLLNVFEAAKTWGVRRVGVASSVGVYDGDDASPLLESSPLPLSAHHPIGSSKKVNEVLASYLGQPLDLEIYSARISAIWGPLGRPISRFFATPQLIRAAAAGEEPDFSALPGGRPPHAADGFDMMYVRDCGRALAALQLAAHLEHGVYNVASGRATTYQELVDAIAVALPGTKLALPEGHDEELPLPRIFLDISRLRQDAGYEPAYDTERAVADYIAWLRAGNEQ